MSTGPTPTSVAQAGPSGNVPDEFLKLVRFAEWNAVPGQEGLERLLGRLLGVKESALEHGRVRRDADLDCPQVARYKVQPGGDLREARIVRLHTAAAPHA